MFHRLAYKKDDKIISLIFNYQELSKNFNQGQIYEKCMKNILLYLL